MVAGEQTLLKVWQITENTMAKQLRELRPDGLSDHAAMKILDHAIAIEKAAAAVKLLVAERATAHAGAKGAADDLARKSGTSKRKAKEELETAKRLKNQPELEDALRDGQLSEEQASAISDAAAVNPGAVSDLVDKAKSEPLNGLKDACGKAKADADPDEEATHRRIHSTRYFRTGFDPDGAFSGSFRMTRANDAKFMAHLQPFREAMFKAAKEAGKWEPNEAYDLDALLAMASPAHAKATGGADPQATTKLPATVYMVVDWARFTDDHDTGGDAAYIAGFGPVPESVVRDVMEDAFLVGVVMHGTEVAKIKRFGRRFGAEIRDALLVKHRFRCSTPGCNNWVRLEMDHVKPYSKGGETSYGNGDLPCKTCHDKKTAQDRLFWDSS